LVQGVGQFLYALAQRIHLTLVRNTQTRQRFAQTVIKGSLHAVHGFTGMVAHPLANLVYSYCLASGLALHFSASFHQSIKKPTALFLRASKGAQTSQPDLMGVFAQIPGCARQCPQRAAALFFRLLILRSPL